MNFFHTNKKGFTILFAVLVSSILLAVGASIFNITTKNLLFASSGRESLRAFAAADTGLECALYWDKNGDGIFRAPNQTRPSSFNDIAQCVGKKLTAPESLWITSSSQGITTTSFKIESDNVCVVVLVKKSLIGGTEKINTKIESRGYNTCDETNQRRLERGVKISYDEI